jgi:hypothetical protein
MCEIWSVMLGNMKLEKKLTSQTDIADAEASTRPTDLHSDPKYPDLSITRIVMEMQLS